MSVFPSELKDISEIMQITIYKELNCFKPSPLNTILHLLPG